jgi:hypothetical protein
MSWRSAFLAQARSDNAVRKLLNRERVEYAHQLHYLQMVAEKLAKGFMTPESAADPPDFSHGAIVRFLQILKGRPEMRRQLGYADRATFRSFINSLLPFVESVERLAPSHAGKTQPNPEYPWQPTPADEVVVPCEFDFPAFNPTDPKIIKFTELLESLLRIAV